MKARARFLFCVESRLTDGRAEGPQGEGESDKLTISITPDLRAGQAVLRMVVTFDAECRCCGWTFEPVGADNGEAARSAYRLGLLHGHDYLIAADGRVMLARGSHRQRRQA